MTIIAWMLFSSGAVAIIGLIVFIIMECVALYKDVKDMKDHSENCTDF